MACGAMLNDTGMAGGTVWRAMPCIVAPAHLEEPHGVELRRRDAHGLVRRQWSLDGLCDDGRKWPQRGRSLDSQVRMVAGWLDDDGRGSAKAATVVGGLTARWRRVQERCR